MYNIINIDELKEAIKFKSDFELAREFTFWSSEEIKLVAKELNNRRGLLSIFIFFLVGLLTNTLLFFTEVQASFRWLYFEDRPNQIVRQYVAGFAYLSILSLFFGIVDFFQNNLNDFFWFQYLFTDLHLLLER